MPRASRCIQASLPACHRRVVNREVNAMRLLFAISLIVLIGLANCGNVHAQVAPPGTTWCTGTRESRPFRNAVKRIVSRFSRRQP